LRSGPSGKEQGGKACRASWAGGGVAVRVVRVLGRPVSVVAGERGVLRVVLGRALRPLEGTGRARYWAELAARQIEEYFLGTRQRFTAAVDFAGLSDFRRRVLTACAEIPFGEVRSYREVGETAGLGRGAARAVGQALAANPVPVIVPCHRVVKSDGSVGGFAAGRGWKKLLLRLEARCAKVGRV